MEQAGKQNWDPFNKEVIETLKGRAEKQVGSFIKSVMDVFNAYLGLDPEEGLLELYQTLVFTGDVDLDCLPVDSPLRQLIEARQTSTAKFFKLNVLTIDIPNTTAHIRIWINEQGYLEIYAADNLSGASLNVRTNIFRLGGGEGDLPFTNTTVRLYKPTDEINLHGKHPGENFYEKIEYTLFSPGYEKQETGPPIPVTYPLYVKHNNGLIEADADYGSDGSDDFQLLPHKLKINGKPASSLAALGDGGKTNEEVPVLPLFLGMHEVSVRLTNEGVVLKSDNDRSGMPAIFIPNRVNILQLFEEISGNFLPSGNDPLALPEE